MNKRQPTDDDQLPRDDESERLVLGAVIAFPQCGADVFPYLHPRDFFDGRNQAVYKAILAQRSRGIVEIEQKLLARELKGHPEFPPDKDNPEGNPGAFLIELAGEATPAHAKYYSDRVRVAAQKRCLLSIGKSLVEDAQNGKAPADIVSAFRADLDDFERESNRDKPREQFTLRELWAEGTTLDPPIIDGLARAGETVNLVSHSKVGKSWLVGGLLLSNAIQQPWLGRFPTAGGRSLLIDNELKRKTISWRLKVIADAMGISKELCQDNIEVRAVRGRLKSWPEICAELSEIQPGDFSIIAFDSKYRFSVAGTSENDNTAETQTYNLLDSLAERTGATIVLVHHASKGMQSDKRVTDVGSGAGSQSRATDSHIVLREHEEPDVAVLDAAVRSFPPVESLALRWAFPLWAPAYGADPTQLKRQQTARQQQQENKDRKDVDQIIKALRNGPTTPRALRAKTGLSRERQQRLLDWMQSEGHVTSTETTIRGNQTREYTLIEDSK